MKLYTQLTRKQFDTLNDQKKIYPTLTGMFIDTLKQTENIGQLTFYDVWDLAKLIDAVDGSNIDAMKLIKQFSK